MFRSLAVANLRAYALSVGRVDGASVTTVAWHAAVTTPAIASIRCEHYAVGQTATTAIFAIRAFHSAGPVSCTDVPSESTATVTGMPFSLNS